MDAGARSEGQETPGGWRRLLAGWIAISVRFGASQTLVILSLLYVALFGPVALGLRLTRRDLLERRGLRSGGSAWREADSARPDLERARLAS